MLRPIISNQFFCKTYRTGFKPCPFFPPHMLTWQSCTHDTCSLWLALGTAFLRGVKFDSKTKCRCINVSAAFGSPSFKLFAEHQDFIEEFKSKRLNLPILFVVCTVELRLSHHRVLRLSSR